jgi:hypothetical protein
MYLRILDLARKPFDWRSKGLFILNNAKRRHRGGGRP